MIKIVNNISFGIDLHISLCYLPGLLWIWSCWKHQQVHTSEVLITRICWDPSKMHQSMKEIQHHGSSVLNEETLGL